MCVYMYLHMLYVFAHVLFVQTNRGTNVIEHHLYVFVCICKYLHIYAGRACAMTYSHAHLRAMTRFMCVP